jgi:hypothetical protein
VRSEVERPDDVEGHLAVETETLKAYGRDLVAVLVEGTNLSSESHQPNGIILEREGETDCFHGGSGHVVGQIRERRERGGRLHLRSKPCYLSVTEGRFDAITNAEVKRRPDSPSDAHQSLLISEN